MRESKRERQQLKWNDKKTEHLREKGWSIGEVHDKPSQRKKIKVWNLDSM